MLWPFMFFEKSPPPQGGGFERCCQMKTCALCSRQIDIDSYFSRKSSCPQCGGDLTICLNCKFYSKKSHNKCLEPKAEFQRSRDKANFCDYFTFKESFAASSGKEKDEAFRTLEDLFKKPWSSDSLCSLCSLLFDHPVIFAHPMYLQQSCQEGMPFPQSKHQIKKGEGFTSPDKLLIG